MAAPAAVPNGTAVAPTTPVPRTELEEIQLSINNKADESLEATRRMVASLEESKDAGIRTLVMLDEQGEQLERVNAGMDQINEGMREAEKNLTGLDKCCGICVCPWNKGKNFEKGTDYDQTWKSTGDGKLENQPRAVISDGSGIGPTGGYITRITNDSRETEMEENMGQVTSMITNLRNMAVDMNGELNTQNQLLEQVNKKTSSNEERVREANKRAEGLLKKA